MSGYTNTYQYTNDTNSNLAYFEYKELLEYLITNEKFNEDDINILDKNKKTKTDCKKVFIEEDKVETLFNDFKENKDISVINDYMKHLSYETKNIYNVEFEYNNQMVNEQIELGKTINVDFIDPSNEDLKLINQMEKNAFFKGFKSNEILVVSEVETDNKYYMVNNICFTEEDVNSYLSKYPNTEELKVNKPKEDSMNLVAQQQQQRCLEF